MAEFNEELYMCKALTLEKEKIVQGFYICKGKTNKGHYICCPFGEEINPYTLCRNTGIKKNGVYLYEWDLVEYSSAFEKGMAIIEFDEMRCRYMLRLNLDYSAKTDIERYNIKVIGNVTLSDDDMKKFDDYSKNQKFEKDVQPECRSKAYLNKLAKEFLPR